MMLRFDDPQLLWLAVLSVPLGVLGLVWFRAMIVTRRVSAILARAILFVLIAGALAGARTVAESRILATVAVVDVSKSVRTFGSVDGDISGAVRTFLQDSTIDRNPDDLLGVVVFDRRALAIGTPSRADVLSRSFDGSGLDGTDIASGLRLAGGVVPPDATGRLVLFSDGNETLGDAAQVAAALGASDAVNAQGSIAIDVVPISYRVDREVVVESLDAPPRAAAESTVSLRVIIRSTSRTQGMLELLREGEPFDFDGADSPGLGRRISLSPGRNIELIQVPLEPGPVHRFEAIFVPDADEDGFDGDAILANNRATAFTLTPGRGSVLLVDGVSNGSATGPGATLAKVLEEGGINVRIVAPAGFPNQMLDLQGYDLIMLENVPAEALDEAQQEMLVSQVRDLGTGLVMIGGPDSFGAGGWYGTQVADILPVRLDLPDQIIVPEAAIMFVLDSSGSMGASVMGSIRSQQQIANEAAAMAIQSLDKTDLVGAIAFNDSYRVVKALGPNTDPDRTASRVRSIGSGGGTTLGPAMREAQRQLAKAEAKLKQIIVLTDGRSSDEEFLEPLAATMARQGIRVTTIGVGDQADSNTLAAVARAGGGAFYSVINPNLLPRIFLKAVRIVRSPLVRERSEPVVVRDAGSPFIAGLSDFPPIEGLVLTRDRDEPGVTTALATSEGEPVLAHWNIGLGQVVAFTSDAHAWTRYWLDSPAYRTLWLQLVRTASRVREDSNSEIAVTTSGGILQIAFDAVDRDGRPQDLLDVPVSVFGPGGTPTQLRLLQTGPGRYEAAISATDSGPYIVIAKPMRGPTRLTPMLAGATVGAGSELSRLEPDETLLTTIAQRSGGRVLNLSEPSPGLLFDRSNIVPRRTSTPLWPMLVAWAILVYLVDVGTRRVAWDRFISKRYGASLVEGMKVATTTRDTRSISQLLATRKMESSHADLETLGAEDAARIASQAKKARREAYRQRHTDSMTNQGSRDAAGDEPESGLLAAKRRAQRRYEGDNDER
jgi:Ca-activated chloride channel homolog